MKQHPFEQYQKNFLICGIVGWCMEIIFTAAGSLLHPKNPRHPDHRLMGHTSLWMFPIYGLAAFIYPISRRLRGLPAALRGAIYSGGILTVEYVSGMLLKHFSCCPWDYGKAKYNVHGVIRLDYAPFWAGAGLIFEKILSLENDRSFH